MSQAAPRGTGLGATVLALLIVGVTFWLYAQGRTTAIAGARNADAGVATTTRALGLPDDGMLGFVEILPGAFLMGSDPAVDRAAFENERWSAAEVQGTVDLPAYYIGRSEVTVGAYRAFVEATGHRADPQALAAPPSHPIASVSWPDALAYCRWLDGELRRSPETPPAIRARLDEGWRVTLPSEAQWEKAARGPDGRVFPWGNEPRRDRANFRSTGPVPVGSIECPECAYGLVDMSGNVWEWTRSPYQPYPFTEADDLRDLETDALWVMRGGSFSDPESNVRAAVRGGGDPGVRRPFIGFRVAVVSK
jgi:formylglycine-generating enzyme required for sulfatase activity